MIHIRLRPRDYRGCRVVTGDVCLILKATSLMTGPTLLTIIMHPQKNVRMRLIRHGMEVMQLQRHHASAPSMIGSCLWRHSEDATYIITLWTNGAD